MVVRYIPDYLHQNIIKIQTYHKTIFLMGRVGKTFFGCKYIFINLLFEV